MDAVVNVPVLLVCVAALVISIFMNVKFKAHLGVVCMFFAYMIGVGMMGMSTRDLLSSMPIDIIAIFMCALPFFSAISSTGMLEKLGKRLIRATHGNARLLPIACVVAIAFVSCASEVTVMYALGPIIAALCLLAGMDLMIACMLFSFSIPIGSCNPWTTMTGQTILGLAATHEVENGFGLGTAIWGNMTIMGIVMIVITLIVFKGFKVKRVDVDESEDLTFTRDQRVAFTLFITALVLLVVPSMLSVLCPSVALFGWLKSVLNVYSVYLLMNILCLFLKIATYDETIKRVPWSIIVTLSGVMLLIDVAGAAGISTLLSNFIVSNIPVFLIPAIFTLCSAGLSFVATFFAVLPMLWPVAMAVSASTGISLAVLISCICVGAIGSGSSSPLSAMGAMILSAMPAEHQAGLTPRMIRYTFVAIAVFVLLALLGVFNFIPNLLGV